MSLRSTVEGLIRDKASLAVITVAIIFFYGESVADIFELLRFFGLLVYGGYVAYLGYRYKDAKAVEHAKDVIADLTSTVSKVLEIVNDDKTTDRYDDKTRPDRSTWPI